MNSRIGLLDKQFFTRAEHLASGEFSGKHELKEDKGLHLTGLEVVAFLGAKIVVPIVCAFIKDTLYEKYKELKTRGAADKAKEVLLSSRGPFKLAVDRQILLSEMTESLVSEGLSAEVAKRAVERTISYVEQQLVSPRNEAAAVTAP